MNDDNKFIVLLVDDQLIIHEAIRRCLADQPNLVLHCCDDGSKALKIAEELKPHVILQDLVMPDVNGLMLVQYYRVNPATRDVPIIVLSSKEESEIKAKAFALGANDYIVKLPDQTELLARLQYHAKAYENLQQRAKVFHQLKDNQKILVKLNRQLEEEQKELKKLNEIKNRFLSIAAHDLRNPLSAIRCFAEFLTEPDMGSLNKEQRDLVDNIATTSNAMLTLVNDLLDVSVIESGRLKLKLGEHDMPHLIKNVVHLNHIIAQRKHITVSFDAMVDQANQVFDPERFRQVVDNLISNAIKYSPSYTTVYVRLRIAKERIQLQVKDEGPGIPEDEQGKLFQPFGKTSVQATAGEKSTGLGLALSKRMIEAHGGDIRVESTPGAGSSFIVELNSDALRNSLQ
ncbi:MAG: hybrid sensor histidine kinase/response regulator [Mariprofundaceae bacterium]|nr:hybrid sensor histidine kinase/response regulator [Mariprofundaceae bacterium]